MTFNCFVGNSPFYAVPVGNTILFLDWDKKPVEDAIEAMGGITYAARVHGYEKVRIFLDKYDPDFDTLVKYAKSVGGIETWTDGRFIEYEWSV